MRVGDRSFARAHGIRAGLATDRLVQASPAVPSKLPASSAGFSAQRVAAVSGAAAVSESAAMEAGQATEWTAASEAGEADSEPSGLADLHAALRLVRSGQAFSVTLCGFGDGEELLRMGRQMAADSVVVEPLARHHGDGIDVRVRRSPAPEV